MAGARAGPFGHHYLKFAEQRAMGRRLSDKFTAPICRLHHRELHRRGDERDWCARRQDEILAAMFICFAGFGDVIFGFKAMGQLAIRPNDLGSSSI